uniref:Transmembrane protein 272 n=1 Tax=Ailuropoda melanoleuca TaxID=9646 RepID=A0A7N5JAG4_AILME
MPGGLEKACYQCILKIASNACSVLVLSALPALLLSMAFTGTKFLEDCPIQPLISLYLLVGGIIGALKVSLLLSDCSRMRRLLSKAMVIDGDEDDYPWRQKAHACIRLSLSLFLWFVLGNYWVFSIYLPDFVPPFQQPQGYCGKPLYLFAGGVLVLSHTVLALVLGRGCAYVWPRGRCVVDED